MNNVWTIMNLAGGVAITAFVPHFYPSGPWWARIGLIALATGCFYVAIKGIK